MGLWDGVLVMDTSSVIAFVEEAQRPDLFVELARRFKGVEVPDTAFDELEDPDSRGGVERIDEVSVFEAGGLELYQDMFDRYPQLGPGELGVIARGVALAWGGPQYTCVLDDGAARRVAEERGLELTGTIGLLILLEESDLVTRDEHVAIIARLKAAGFHYRWDQHPLGLG